MADDKDEKNGKNKITAGSVAGQVVSLSLNPSREKIKEFTFINRYQATLFPLFDTVITGRKYILELSLFRQVGPKEYKRIMKAAGRIETEPVMPDLADELLYTTAQWQKSIAGKNLDKSMEVAIAEIESKSDVPGYSSYDMDEDDED